MKIGDLLERYARSLGQERGMVASRGLDTPAPASGGRLLRTVGTLHLYAFRLSSSTDGALLEDVPITIVPAGEAEPTEGFVLAQRGADVTIQTFDHLGTALSSATLVPDATAFVDGAAQRLTEMATKPEFFSLGPSERVLPWLDLERTRDEHSLRSPVSLAVFTTIWNENVVDRRAAVATAAVELARSNKRVLVVTAEHQTADAMTGILARVLRAAGLSFKSLLSRYELSVESETAGMALTELGFEAQMHQFYAQSRADKAALRRKYERFRELTPLLAYKAEKQKDLDEVKLLEWRLLTQMTELQDKIKEIDATLADYERLPIVKRLAMQAVGKNVASLAEYRTLYEQQIEKLKGEVDVAKERIAVLAPEAAIPKDMRPEYEELKEEIVRLGGTKKIRELLAAEEGTNRQAFIQNKRLVVTTAARVATDPLFRRVRFDAVIAENAPAIPAPFLMAAAGLAREKLIVTGDPAQIPAPTAWMQVLR